jgi:hypothetical protein
MAGNQGAADGVTMKAEPQPNYDVNRVSGTASDNSRPLR